MKAYIPRPGDVAMDLQRCFELSLSTKSFKSNDFKKFYKHALNDLEKTKHNINTISLKNIKKCLDRVQNNNINIVKRQEDLLTASNILLNVDN